MITTPWQWTLHAWDKVRWQGTFWLVQNYRDVSMQGHCVSGTIHPGNQGSQKIRTGTQFQEVQSSHQIMQLHYPNLILRKSLIFSAHPALNLISVLCAV